MSTLTIYSAASTSTIDCQLFKIEFNMLKNQ
jgi:hypothetical protein